MAGGHGRMGDNSRASQEASCVLAGLNHSIARQCDGGSEMMPRQGSSPWYGPGPRGSENSVAIGLEEEIRVARLGRKVQTEEAPKDT
ncbi:hypothetical protein GQ55_6G018000 [Panicum hallii var. hallii]|uniref:Uncharacterized protein n=1 Tax=Panicum hallii var. hallii TaxID=1504633 RepID=A0A2T7D2U0_9POAL|nr:hypothetical protein GQ55_6G018000 [Panicum hallii var. hallii]